MNHFYISKNDKKYNFPQAIFSRFQQNTALLNVKSNVNDFYSMAERVKNNRFEFPKKKPGGGKRP